MGKLRWVMLIVVIAIAVGMYVWPYLFDQKESPPVIELEKGSAIKLAKQSIFYEWFIFYGGPFLRYYEEDYNITAEKISTDAVVDECGKQLPERNYWVVNFCSPATCLKIFIDYDDKKPVCFIQTTLMYRGPPYREKLSYGIVIDKLTKEPIPNASVWGEETSQSSGHFYSVYIVKQKTDKYGIYLIKKHDPNYIYSGISNIFIFKEGYAPTIMMEKETELKPLEEGRSGIIILINNIESVSNFSLCKTDSGCIDTFDKIGLSEGEAGLEYNIKPKLYLLGEVPSGNYNKLIVNNETFNISIELQSRKLHYFEKSESGTEVLVTPPEPPEIPTVSTGYWNKHKSQYTKINDTHYTHNGNTDQIGYGWKNGYHLTVLGDADIRAGWLMQGGTIIIKGNASDDVGTSMQGGTIVVHGDAGDAVGASMRGGTIIIQGNTGRGIGQRMQGGTIIIKGNAENNTGAKMSNGKIYIEGKAEPIATGEYAPQGGEIWEYWGTPQQRRIFPAS